MLVFVLLLLCSIVCTRAEINIQGDNITNHEWDVLIFTQHWPATVCYQWKEKEEKHSCSLPSQKDIWTVHGIWPTKLGTIGPQFCNSSMKFDPVQLSSLETQLEQFWINIEKDTPLYSFWKHEWVKHGTCASVLPQLENENKYFGQGLRWLQQYSMSGILDSAGIHPNSTNTPLDIYNAVRDRIGKNPALECIHDIKTGLSYIFEIRICFGKDLRLTDCDGIKETVLTRQGKIISNCDLTKTVIYPHLIPLPAIETEYNTKTYMETYFRHLVNLYKFAKWIQWFTL